MKIFRLINDENIDTSYLQNDVDLVDQWTSTWLLKLNPNKYKKMSISSIHNKCTLKRSYSLSTENGRYQLANSEKEKEIGVVVDSKLKCDKHITETVTKANQIVVIIIQNFRFLREKNYASL